MDMPTIAFQHDVAEKLPIHDDVRQLIRLHGNDHLQVRRAGIIPVDAFCLFGDGLPAVPDLLDSFLSGHVHVYALLSTYQKSTLRGAGCLIFFHDFKVLRRTKACFLAGIDDVVVACHSRVISVVHLAFFQPSPALTTQKTHFHFRLFRQRFRFLNLTCSKIFILFQERFFFFFAHCGKLVSELIVNIIVFLIPKTQFQHDYFTSLKTKS
nr:MAG TPA: hypothetical protein [Caudoviricetes sp.]